MVFLPSGLELRPSPVAGLGVFATEDLSANRCLGEFVGTPMKHDEFKAKYGTDYRYVCRQRRTWLYRVAKEERNFITFMNDGKHGQTENKVNVRIKNWRAYTTRDIKAGEELFLDYGYAYPWHLG